MGSFITDIDAPHPPEGVVELDRAAIASYSVHLAHNPYRISLELDDGRKYALFFYLTEDEPDFDFLITVNALRLPIRHYGYVLHLLEAGEMSYLTVLVKHPVTQAKHWALDTTC